MQRAMSQPAAAARRTPPRVRPPGEIFAGYALDSAYEEMFDASGQAPPDCRALFEELVAAPWMSRDAGAPLRDNEPDEQQQQQQQQ